MAIRCSSWSLAVTLCGTAFAGPALAGGEAGQLVLRDVGVMAIGIETVSQDNGTVDVANPMAVTYFLPAEPAHEYPLVLVHGGGGQAWDWLETPDGRDGWSDYFAAAGFDVYVVDRPGYGRSQRNPSCGSFDDAFSPANNSAFISQLASSDASVWPGGAPTPANENVVRWTATSGRGPYCGNDVAAADIAELLERVGPAIVIAHSAGGPSTFQATDMRPGSVVGIIAFEVAGSQPLEPSFGGSPLVADLTMVPRELATIDNDGCTMQGGRPGELPNFAGIQLVLVGSEYGPSVEDLRCETAVWQQLGVQTRYVHLPDAGHPGGGHFSMAQLDNGEIAQTFIEMAAEIEAANAK
jgi:pimeloyl-ACP methyl ester carboxylesterase